MNRPIDPHELHGLRSETDTRRDLLIDAELLRRLTLPVNQRDGACEKIAARLRQSGNPAVVGPKAPKTGDFTPGFRRVCPDADRYLLYDDGIIRRRFGVHKLCAKVKVDSNQEMWRLCNESGTANVYPFENFWHRWKDPQGMGFPLVSPPRFVVLFQCTQPVMWTAFALQNR